MFCLNSVINVEQVSRSYCKVKSVKTYQDFNRKNGSVIIFRMHKIIVLRGVMIFGGKFE